MDVLSWRTTELATVLDRERSCLRGAILTSSRPVSKFSRLVPDGETYRDEVVGSTGGQ